LAPVTASVWVTETPTKGRVVGLPTTTGPSGTAKMMLTEVLTGRPSMTSLEVKIVCPPVPETCMNSRAPRAGISKARRPTTAHMANRDVLDFFKYRVVILFLIFLGGLLNCTNCNPGQPGNQGLASARRF